MLKMEIDTPDLPDTDYILIPPTTIFYPPVAEVPYLDPLLLPSLEQVKSGLGEDQAVDSSKEEEAIYCDSSRVNSNASCSNTTEKSI